jgi:hypothetical protein
VRDLLKELDSGVHDKLSMLKMIAVKCGDADTSYKKIRQHLVKGDVTQAEKLVIMLEQMNSIILRDITAELH